MNVIERTAPPSRTEIWQVLTGIFLVLSILRGIRFPGMWPYTHYLFNYGSGFTKRSLVGSAAGFFQSSCFISYDFFLTISLLFLCADIILIFVLSRDLIRTNHPALIGCTLVFSSSLAVVFFAHTVGYFDHWGLLVSLIAVRLHGFYKKLIFLTLTMPVLVLIHEALIVIFLPVLFVSLLLSIQEPNRKIKTLFAGLFAAGLCCGTSIIAGSTLDAGAAFRMFQSLQSVIALHLRQDAFHLLYRSAGTNFEIMNSLWSNSEFFSRLIKSATVTIPCCIFFICFSVSSLRKNKSGLLAVILSIPASLSPLLLHLMGTDMDRWNTLAITTSFMMLHVSSASFPIRTEYPRLPRIWCLIVLLIFMSGISSIELFDGYQVRPFPFTELVRYMMDVFRGTEPFPLIPVR